jgi:hypothetical protein
MPTTGAKTGVIGLWILVGLGMTYEASMSMPVAVTVTVTMMVVVVVTMLMTLCFSWSVARTRHTGLLLQLLDTPGMQRPRVGARGLQTRMRQYL